MKTRTTITLGCTILVALAAGLAYAQYDASWYTIDGGGAMRSTGGTYELSGTIGQPDASTTLLTGGSYELIGGFWPVAASTGACACPADMNADGSRNGTDIRQFVSCFLGAGGSCTCANLDANPVLDMADVTAFVNRLLTQPNCP